MKDNREMLEALGGLISIASVSSPENSATPYGKEVDKALNYALKLCADLGFRTKNCDGKIGYAEIGDGEELIGILAHLDVVPAGSGWDYPPFACTLADGRIYGRGISDDKGPAIAAVFAMHDIKERAVKLNKRIRIIFGLTEESGDWDDMEYYKANEEIPAYGFTPDADFPAIYGEKGIAQYRIAFPIENSGFLTINGGEAVNVVCDRCEASVLTREGVKAFSEDGVAAHGSTPEDGKNAISCLMSKIAAEADTEIPFADIYNSCFGFDLNGVMLGCGFEDTQSGKLTCNVGRISTEEDKIVLYIDIRYPVTFTEEDVRVKICSRMAEFGAEVELQSHMKPVYSDKNGAVIKALSRAYRDVTGDVESPVTVIGGGTYARAMDNIVAFGPMIPGHELTEHMKNEYLTEEDFYMLREIYFRALENLLAL